MLKTHPVQNSAQTFYSCFNYEKFLKIIKDSSLKENFLFQIIYYSGKLDVDFNDSESYEKLKKLIIKHKESLTLDFYYTATSRLMNCALFQEKGEATYYKNDYLDFYDELIRKALMEKKIDFLNNSVFNIRAIYNAVKILIKLNMTKRLEEFIRSNSKYFQPEIRKDSINFAEGALEFSNGCYEKALKILSKNEFTIPMIVKEIKIMKMKACYELCYSDMLDAEIDSYRHYLSNTSEIQEDYKDKDRVFLKLLQRLSKVREQTNHKELEFLKREIKNLGFITLHTNWLLRKIKELESA
jgi:hypothetical protein